MEQHHGGNTQNKEKPAHFRYPVKIHQISVLLRFDYRKYRHEKCRLPSPQG
jgi:hypothetical protein